MPLLIDYIDKIAREKQRDVLFLEFFHHPVPERNEDGLIPPFRYEECAIRQTLLEWFEQNNITVYPCGPFSKGKFIEGSYRGQLYIDVPFDKNNADYQKIEQFLENADGTIKFPGVGFWCLTLETAMEYAYSDEPGYWDRYWDNIDLEWIEKIFPDKNQSDKN